ncbi:hypothetical protein FKP32DRAFT_173519 [Trametes sanguinea]|nr:hypothetical protein FKP32DRAFT_173519 [Trametes sanguinea]
MVRGCVTRPPRLRDPTHTRSVGARTPRNLRDTAVANRERDIHSYSPITSAVQVIQQTWWLLDPCGCQRQSRRKGVNRCPTSEDVCGLCAPDVANAWSTLMHTAEDVIAGAASNSRRSVCGHRRRGRREEWEDEKPRTTDWPSDTRHVTSHGRLSPCAVGQAQARARR